MLVGHCVITVDYKELVTVCIWNFGSQVQILTRMYPCKECADHFKEVIRYSIFLSLYPAVDHQ